MKLLILPALFAMLAAGWLGGSASADKSSTSTSTQCRATVECTPNGTCVVVCYDENGNECCRKELPCDPDCDERSSCSTR